MNTTLPKDKIEQLGVWQAATNDGYWEAAANDDIQFVYLLGQLQATQSIHKSYGNQIRRIKELNSKITEIEKRLIK